MALWYNTRPRTTANNGKFASTQPRGAERCCGSPYRGWAYHLTHHRTGSTVRRAVYHVTIFDPAGNRRSYLPGHGTAGEAQRAAKSWIDQHV